MTLDHKSDPVYTCFAKCITVNVIYCSFFYTLSTTNAGAAQDEDVSPPVSAVVSAIRPLASVGIRNGMLITPTRSSMGMSERRMARIRMASPFPAWISWRRRITGTHRSHHERNVTDIKPYVTCVNSEDDLHRKHSHTVGRILNICRI